MFQKSLNPPSWRSKRSYPQRVFEWRASNNGADLHHIRCLDLCLDHRDRWGQVLNQLPRRQVNLEAQRPPADLDGVPVLFLVSLAPQYRDVQS